MKHTFTAHWLTSFISLLFPRSCVVCGGPLGKGEEYFCSRCNMDLPRTYSYLRVDNPVERFFWGRLPVIRAASYFYYRKDSGSHQIIHLLKYGGCKEIGKVLGRYMAAELLASGFFRNIDILIPIPLHKKKQQLRGYNQSEWIARGVSAVTGIPVYPASVVRQRNSETQTRKSTYERWENVNGIFELHHPEAFAGKHILIVDDVLTTGSTVIACASAFKEVEGIKISVLTLAVALQ